MHLNGQDHQALSRNLFRGSFATRSTRPWKQYLLPVQSGTPVPQPISDRPQSPGANSKSQLGYPWPITRHRNHQSDLWKNRPYPAGPAPLLWK